MKPSAFVTSHISPSRSPCPPPSSPSSSSSSSSSSTSTFTSNSDSTRITMIDPRIPFPSQTAHHHHHRQHDHDHAQAQTQTLPPPGHFLSLPPTFSTPTETYPSGHPTTSSHTSNGQAPNTSSLSSADFGVDVRTGFLPATTNLDKLPGEYIVWEKALEAATGGGVVGGGLKLEAWGERERLWRSGIESMEVLSTCHLDTLPLLQRAHLVLTFLLHFYAHTWPKNDDRQRPIPIPPSISVPLMTISPLLGLPPILTYADTVLYNFHALDPTIPPSLPLNPPTRSLASFTGTKSEEQFYIISALCEIAGSSALRLMRQSLDELFIGDETAIKRLTKYLKHLSHQIDKVADLTESMIQNIDPEEFYHLIRPWFKGGDADGDDSLGWAFMGLPEGSDEIIWEAENKRCKSEQRYQAVKGRKFSGPSAGQSSLIHAIDVFLTVDHTTVVTTGSQQSTTTTTTTQEIKIELDSTPITSSSSALSPASPSLPDVKTITTPTPTPTPHLVEATYLQRMLSYMPLPHRTFLLHLSTHPTPLRNLVLTHSLTHPKLASAYDGALDSLKKFREKHMRVVSVFIVQQARREPSLRIRRLLGRVSDGDEDEEDEDEVTSEESQGGAEDPKGKGNNKAKPSEIGELRGTGGTALFKFLKMCRDNTSRAMVSRKGASGYELE